MNDPLIGQQLDEYRLEALLGRGGMARVYRALDVRLKRYAAVKVIDVQFRDDSEYVKRFEIEAQAIAKLEHSNIVHVYRYGEVNGLLYMAMQYIEGADLGSVLAGYRQDREYIEPEDALRITRQIGAALDFAHGCGVIHRDVKPSNVILDKGGAAHLTDFGLVLLKDLGTLGEIFGSPHYIAPEQAISSAGTVPQSDLYALGVILYEMFTGQLPFDADSPMGIAMLHMTEPPRPLRELRPEIAPELEAVILMALAKDPSERYPTGTALADGLERALRTHTPDTASIGSRKTVFDRIGVQAAAHPLPPIPPAVAARPPELPGPRATGTVESVPVTATLPVRASGRARSRSMMAILIGAGTALLLCLLAGVLSVMYLSQYRGAPATQGAPPTADRSLGTAAPLVATTVTVTMKSSGTVTATVKPSVALTATSTVSSTPTVAPVRLSPVPSQTFPSMTASAPIPITFRILIARRADGDSLLLVNQSEMEQEFPLGPIRLQADKESMSGSEWGVAVLKRGECVTALKGGGKPRLPDLQCRQVGPSVTRDGKRAFWGSEFQVYYREKLLGSCKSEECKFDVAGQ